MQRWLTQGIFRVRNGKCALIRVLAPEVLVHCVARELTGTLHLDQADGLAGFQGRLSMIMRGEKPLSIIPPTQRHFHG